ncbi:MAG: hypothetical protein A2Y17_07720 [Clostridiales bacterium GWF2_38_85]|nr:MAG: hypothetical protein A2Y17_07720 [Clostridiales bacterium GWF2_38_85]
MNKIIAALRSSQFGRLFNFSDQDAKGRSCMLSSSILTAVVSSITGGIFYSGFLVGHGINIVNIGIITFIPFIATLFSLFSPMILERFKQRKKVLLISRIAYYVINILGLTVLPELVHSDSGKIIGFCIIVFVASAINSLFSSGYSVWHLNFLPDNIRADYFNISSAVANAIMGVVVLISSLITDSLAGSPQQLQIITILRIIGFAFAMFDIFMLSLPKEYPYEQTAGKKPKLADTFILPFRHKKFLLTMLVMFGYTFASNLTASVVNTYLLEYVGVTYTFVNMITASYFIFFIMFGGIAKRIIRQLSWFKSFAFAVFMLLPTYILYAFVDSSNYQTLMLVVRLSQHLFSVLITITFANFPYINLPAKDRTNYIAFYMIFVNMAALFGMVCGTGFVDIVGDNVINLFGHMFNSVQVLMLTTGTLMAVLSVFVLIIQKKLEPGIPNRI